MSLAPPNIRILSRALITCDAALLLAHVTNKDFYFLPGGHVEAGESTRLAIMRELKEEVDITGGFPNDPTYAGLLEHFWMDQTKSVHEFNHLWFIPLRQFSSPPVPKSRESHLSFSWILISPLKTSIFGLPHSWECCSRGSWGSVVRRYTARRLAA